MKYNIPNIGTKFGEWEVIDNTLVSIYPNSTSSTKNTKGILVKCSHGTKQYRTISALYNGSTTGCSFCKTDKQFKGIGDLSSSYISSIKIGAKNRNIEFVVTLEYLWGLFLEQNKQCSLSGLEITLDPQYSSNCRRGNKEITQTASLDRIDNTRGYEPGNVQWVHKWINIMKLDHNQEYFIEMCELVAKHRKIEPRIRVLIRFSIEGVHRWLKCPIEEVDYLRNYHRHVFNIIGKAYVNHTDRDIEFIQLSHEMKQYLMNKYYNEKYKCCFFDDASCEMLADELSMKFGLYECEVNEDGEGGALVKNLG